MTAPARDAGVTLVELLVAAAVTALIAPVLTGALVIGLRTTDATVDDLSDTRNRQLLPSLFTRDVQAANSVGTSGGACTQAGDSLLVRLVTQETPATGPPTDRVVSWVHTAGALVERRTCDGPGPVTSSVTAAHAVTGTPGVTCKNASGGTTSCATAVVVDLTVTDAAGTFTATGRRRPS